MSDRERLLSCGFSTASWSCPSPPRRFWISPSTAAKCAPASLFFALRGRRRTALNSPPRRPLAARARCCGSPVPASSLRPSRRRFSPRRSPICTGLVGRIADRFFDWPSSQLRIVAITGTNGKTTCAYLVAQCLERLKHHGGLHGHHRLGPHRCARESDPHHAGRRQRASHTRAAQSAGRARGRDGGVLACARSGPHRRRALAHGRVHQPEPRPSGLPPLDAGLR